MQQTSRRLALVGLSLGLAFLVVAAPALGARHSSDVSVGAAAAAPSPKPKREKVPEVEVSVTGTVESGTDAKGRPTYTLTAGGTTWDLSAGPRWYPGANDALEAVVGKSVTVAGTHREGSAELDVQMIDGDEVRATGKPSWAGGPFVVGQAHPGWKPWKVAGKPGLGLGRDGAPGQNKAGETD